MGQILFYNPGQVATVVLETLDSNGIRADGADGYTDPIIERVILPNFSLAANYPQNMIRIDTGLYYANFTIPTGATAVGTYIVDIAFFDPALLVASQTLFQIVVTSPFGIYNSGQS